MFLEMERKGQQDMHSMASDFGKGRARHTITHNSFLILRREKYDAEVDLEQGRGGYYTR